jgi:hypothetical protein
VPAQILDLTNWKLTLPTAASGSTTAAEVAQPQLNSFVDTPWFDADSAGDGVAFRANAGGATTSGSGYPRSELREMTDNGSQEASWSTTSGTSTMVVREASTHLPAVKPQVVTAQIHDASDDVVEILADGLRSNSQGTYSICVRLNGAEQSKCLDDYYVQGTPFTLTMTAVAGVITIGYVNGSTSSSMTYDRAQTGCYFKAGAYTQSNTSKGDAASAYGEDVIYGISVTHKP